MPAIHIFTKDGKVSETKNLASLDSLIFASALNLEPHVKEKTIKEAVQSGLNYCEMPFGDASLVVISRFGFFKKIKKAVTPSSGAYYLLWHEEALGDFRQGYLLQYLPPNAVTSKHFHTEQTESFGILEGKLSLETSEGCFPLSAGEDYTIRPQVVHQLRTAEGPSLTVIEIKNVNYRDHHLVE